MDESLLDSLDETPTTINLCPTCRFKVALVPGVRITPVTGDFTHEKTPCQNCSAESPTGWTQTFQVRRVGPDSYLRKDFLATMLHKEVAVNRVGDTWNILGTLSYGREDTWMVTDYGSGCTFDAEEVVDPKKASETKIIVLRGRW